MPDITGVDPGLDLRDEIVDAAGRCQFLVYPGHRLGAVALIDDKLRVTAFFCNILRNIFVYYL